MLPCVSVFFITENASSNSNHVYCYDCIDALYMQLLIHVHEMACVVRHDDDEGIKMRRNGDSGNVYITGRRVHIHSPVLHIHTTY